MKNLTRLLLSIISIFISLNSVVAFNSSRLPEAVVQEHCGYPALDEPTLYAEEFSGSFTLEELKQKEADIYSSGMRLLKRAYIDDQGDVVLTHYSNKPVRLTPNFIKSVIKHVEVAFERGYVDALIFPDMGHSHLFVPIDFYNNVIAPIPVKDQALALEKMLANKDTKVLYHTAEKLKFLNANNKLLDDRHTQWRFYTRNLVGGNNNRGDMSFIFNHDHVANTASDHGPEYKYWGAAFNISISQKGCFAFQRDGETFYFDLSLKDLPYKPSSWI